MENLKKEITVQVIVNCMDYILACFLCPFVLLKVYKIAQCFYPALPMLGYWEFFWVRWGVAIIRKTIFGK